MRIVSRESSGMVYHRPEYRFVGKIRKRNFQTANSLFALIEPREIIKWLFCGCWDEEAEGQIFV